MNIKDFNRVINNINGLINAADKLKVVVNSRPELEDFSIKELKVLVGQARSLLGSQDRIFTCELYHVLGMGNLSAAQSMIFIKKIKEFASYRHILKYLSVCPVDNIAEMSKATNTAEYNCKSLQLQLSTTFD